MVDGIGNSRSEESSEELNEKVEDESNGGKLAEQGEHSRDGRIDMASGESGGNRNTEPNRDANTDVDSDRLISENALSLRENCLCDDRVEHQLKLSH